MALGLGQKAVGIRALVLFGLLWGPAVARANTSNQVCLTTDTSTPLLAEASLRIEGELRAAGFELVLAQTVEGQSVCPEGASQLTLRLKGAELEIAALVPSRTSPLTQLLDVSSPKTTSEIVAVRAVETLRATAIEALAVPGAPADPTWVNFAQGAPPPISRSPQAPSPPVSPKVVLPEATSQAAASREKSFRDRRFAMGVGLGPTGAADAMAAAAAVSLDYQLGPVSLGLRGRASLSPERIDAPDASLLIRAYGIEARALWFPYRGDQVEFALGAQAGLAHVRMDAIELVGPPQGFDGASHSTLALGAGLAFGYRLVQDLSLRVEGWFNGWTDAPNVDLAGAPIVLGRPEWLVTFGPVFLR